MAMAAIDRRFVALAFALGALGLPGPSALAARGDLLGDPETPFAICRNERYALCATAQCFVYGEVAYCECDVMLGSSISLADSFATPTGEEDVCEVNREGVFNGYMVSTYSLPT